MRRTKLCKKDLPALREMLRHYEPGRPFYDYSGLCVVLRCVGYADHHTARRIQSKIQELPGYVGVFLQPPPWTEAGRKKRARILKKWIKEVEEA